MFSFLSKGILKVEVILIFGSARFCSIFVLNSLKNAWSTFSTTLLGFIFGFGCDFCLLQAVIAKIVHNEVKVIPAIKSVIFLSYVS